MTQRAAPEASGVTNLGPLPQAAELALELLRALRPSQPQPLKEGIPPESEEYSPSGQGSSSPCGPAAPKESLEDWETEGGALHARPCKMCGKLVDFTNPWCIHETMEESAWLNK